MRKLAAIVLLAMVWTSQSVAQDLAQSVRSGEVWTGPDGTKRYPKVQLELTDDRYIGWDVRQKTFRRVQVDRRRSTPNNGLYALRAVEAGNEGSLSLYLSTDSEGNVTSCRVLKYSNYDDFDFYACKYVEQNIRFVPPLDERGERESTAFAVKVHYTLDGAIISEQGWPPPKALNKPPRPLTPITLASLELNPDMELPHKVEEFAVGLTVQSDGMPAYCMMTIPTNVDELDTDICLKLLSEFTFEAGQHRETGEAIWSDYHVRVVWE
ncbi:MAG: hypothetical protein Pars2KO_05790 [Parasphingorhabdus sp.]